MDFKDTIAQLSTRVSQLKGQINTEEATKNAFIMPFIQLLGYDVFNPLEVVPEMDCDLVRKKGEKIDYAIMKEGEPIMLIECKHWEQNLSLHDNQLQKYFVASKAKFGVLTNGVTYRFYTDLVAKNLMDETPFLEFNIEDYTEHQVDAIKQFHKSYFDLDSIHSSANDLKYMSELKAQIKNEFSNPSSEFVKLFARKVYDGMITPRLLDQFTTLVKRSVGNHINDVISNRLNQAMQSEEGTTPIQVASPAESMASADASSIEEESSRKNNIETTEEELEGFYLVKSILRDTLPPERITYRDAVSYFAILLDDNNRKPVCRLYFNNLENKRIALLDEDKKETRYSLESLDDIYEYADELKESVERFK